MALTGPTEAMKAMKVRSFYKTDLTHNLNYFCESLSQTEAIITVVLTFFYIFTIFLPEVPD